MTVNKLVMTRNGQFSYEIVGFSPDSRTDVGCVKISKEKSGKYDLEICEDCLEHLIFTRDLLLEFFDEKQFVFDRNINQLVQVSKDTPFDKIEACATRLTCLMRDNWKTRYYDPDRREC